MSKFSNFPRKDILLRQQRPLIFPHPKPALLIADSGFLVATWPLASLSVSYGIPMLIIIAHRGEVGERAKWRFLRIRLERV